MRRRDFLGLAGMATLGAVRLGQSAYQAERLRGLSLERGELERAEPWRWVARHEPGERLSVVYWIRANANQLDPDR